MTKRYTDRVKAKVWTENMTAEMAGPIAGMCIELFRFLSTDKQEKVLEKLRAAHQLRKVTVNNQVVVNPREES